MQDSVYNGLFGALTQSYRLDVIVNNLANVNTTAYKCDKMAFEDVLFHFAHDFLDPNVGITGGVRWPEKDLLTQPRISEKRIDFSQGPLISTGNPLDLAISGPGFFKVQTPTGKIYYTRAGNFSLDSQGFIVDPHGNQLLSTSGPIQIPGRGKITIHQDGSIYLGNTIIGKIDLVEIKNLKDLKKVGENLYTGKKGKNIQEQPAQKSKILQGYLEGSNVQLVKEMVKMIETLRTFEECQKIMTSTNDEDRNLINKVGTPT